MVDCGKVLMDLLVFKSFLTFLPVVRTRISYPKGCCGKDFSNGVLMETGGVVWRCNRNPRHLQLIGEGMPNTLCLHSHNAAVIR